MFPLYIWNIIVKIHLNIYLIYQVDVKYGGLLLVSQWQQHNYVNPRP
jgi:hypothetical protein